MPKVIPLLDFRTHQTMRFIPSVRSEPWRYGSFCTACGVEVPKQEGPWVYSMSLDHTLCAACGEIYAPEVMRELRKYYAYVQSQQASQPDEPKPPR